MEKTAIVTGGARGIGRCIAEQFAKQGYAVYVIDKNRPEREYLGVCYWQGDISKKEVLEEFSRLVLNCQKKVNVIVNNALPIMKGIDECSYEGPDATQQPAGRVGNPMDIANMVLFLCSDQAGFITGENICIDGGMTHQMIYHGDNGWKLEV